MIKLLLVEDDSTFSYIVKNELQEIIGGYEVITATNGAEGLKAWKEYIRILLFRISICL